MNSDAVLPAALKPRDSFPLIRVGRINDGGYLVDRRDIEKTDILLSFGIGAEWSFDVSFQKMKPVRVVAFDATTSIPYLFRNCIKKIYRPWNVKQLFRSFGALLAYPIRFRAPFTHCRLNIGVDTYPGEISVHAIVERFVREGETFFIKMDIEGAEYRIFDQLLAYKNRIVGMVMEVHDFDIHQTEVANFIEKSGLHIAHVHCNNTFPLHDDGTPRLLEISLTSSAPTGVFAGPLPNRLDSSNIEGRQDYAISFSPRIAA